jgi:hypothetical protein
MTDACVPSSGRIGRIPRVFACSLALLGLSGGLGEAQRNPQQADRFTIEIQASLDQLKKDNAALSEEIKRLNRDFQTVSESIGRMERPIAAPPEAWKALGGVGLAFVIAWSVVSALREWGRWKEGEPERSRKIDMEIAERLKTTEDAVDARIRIMIELLRQAQPGATGSQAAARLAGASEGAESLSRNARGRDQKEIPRGKEQGS